MMKQFITRFIAVAIGLLFLIAVGVAVLPLYALAGIVTLIRASHHRSSTLTTPRSQAVASQAEESGQR